MRRVLVSTAVALAVATAAAAPAAAQCAMCATTVANSEEGRALAGSLNSAILLMLAAPYLVFGTFVAVFFRHRIRNRLRGLLRGPAGRTGTRGAAPPSLAG